MVILSQPLAAGWVFIYVLDVLKLCPFQLKGTWLLHLLIDIVIVDIGFIIKFKVVVLSHPLEPVWVLV